MVPMVRLPRVMRKFLKAPPMPRVYKPRVPKRIPEPVQLPEPVWQEKVFEPERDMLGPLPPRVVSAATNQLAGRITCTKLRVGRSFQCPLPACCREPMGETVVFHFPRGDKSKSRRELDKLIDEVDQELESEIQACPQVVSLIHAEEIDVEGDDQEHDVTDDPQLDDEDVLEVQTVGVKRKYDKRGKARKSKRDIGARGNGNMRFFHRYEEIMGSQISGFTLN